MEFNKPLLFDPHTYVGELPVFLYLDRSLRHGLNKTWAKSSCHSQSLPSQPLLPHKPEKVSAAMSNQNKRDRNLLLLFDRPHEPLFVPRKDIESDNEVVFDVPPEYVSDRYKPIYGDLQSRFGEGSQERISVTSTAQLPNLNELKRFGKRENFSVFIPYHQKLAASLINIFMRARNAEELLSIAAYARDQDLNPLLFNYAYSVALLHRPETKNLPIPPLSEVFPTKFIGGDILARALTESSIVADDKRMPIDIPRDYTASNLEIEHRLAYFREDIGINLHHWHWHLVYPGTGPVEIVRKDRRGELFYYMHQQIVARYNVERFCNNLGRVKAFNNFREAIREGYFPKLSTQNGARNWPPRFADASIKDVSREGITTFEILDLERWRDKLYDAIHEGAVIDSNGRSVPLTESKGIDILGDIVEPTDLSLNKNVYGDFHNFGHLAIGFCHDPDGRHLEDYGVMGDSATAMRDPVFYRWHAYIDAIFQEHKSTLPRYSQDQLSFPGVRVTKVEVTTKGRGANQLHTFWQKSVVDMQRGLDFFPQGPVLAKFTHLQHEPFQFKITVENSSEPRTATCRVFIGPKVDERGSPWNFNEHRLMFIELDKFFVQLKKGQTTLERDSSQSSVTIPFERTFRTLGQQSLVELATPEFATFNFCGCGWPQHMLIPKGIEGNGYPCQFFVMISDYQMDKVELPKSQRSCSDAASYCGIRDSLYPDKRSMGYPFDRLARDGVDRLEDFLTSNMSAVDVSIVHTNRTEDKSSSQMKVLENRFGQTKPNNQNQQRPGNSNQSGRPTWN